MLQGEHSAILLTCINLPNDFKTFVLSIFEWLLKTGFTVIAKKVSILLPVVSVDGLMGLGACSDAGRFC